MSVAYIPYVFCLPNCPSFCCPSVCRLCSARSTDKTRGYPRVHDHCRDSGWIAEPLTLQDAYLWHILKWGIVCYASGQSVSDLSIAAVNQTRHELLYSLGRACVKLITTLAFVSVATGHPEGRSITGVIWWWRNVMMLNGIAGPIYGRNRVCDNIQLILKISLIINY